jgi:S1-C subfamily serine protease
VNAKGDVSGLSPLGVPGVSSPAAPAGLRKDARLLWMAGVIALVGALIGGGIVALVEPNNSSTVATVTTNGSVRPGPALVGTTSIPELVKRVLPSVVSIDASTPASGSESVNPFGSSGGLSITPFGDGNSGGETSGGTEDEGTGMIITANGEVITNNHVISGATQITVTLYGQTKQLPAKLVGADPTEDLALLQIEGVSNLPTVTFGATSDLEVGDGVVAIGNALGLSAGTPTVTQGIISALGRTVQASDDGGNATENLTNMIQTDAAINSGNSGGPLVDSSGDVVGMDTAVASSSAGNAPAQNIGFAITADEITQMIPQLAKGGSVGASGAFLGVDVVSMTAQLQEAYNFEPSAGAIVADVVAGSPASVAGLQEGDVIVGFDGSAITSANNLVNAVDKAQPGQGVQLTLWRGQEKMTVMVTLSSAPAG